jgi:hypothetical protein
VPPSIAITDVLIPENFGHGRKRAIDAIVIHVMEGTMSGTLSHFRAPASDVSAHYGVSKRGEIVRYVREEDTAWANGRVYNATAAIVKERPGINPNDYTISIECEGDGKSDATPEQRAAVVALIRDICARRPAIRIDRRQIVRHNEIYARKSCPGAIDVDRIVQLAAAEHGATRRPEPPRVVWSDYFDDYLIVVRVVSDREWYFVQLKQLRATLSSTRAQTPLSRMPLHPGT